MLGLTNANRDGTASGSCEDPDCCSRSASMDQRGNETCGCDPATLCLTISASRDPPPAFPSPLPPQQGGLLVPHEVHSTSS